MNLSFKEFTNSNKKLNLNSKLQKHKKRANKESRKEGIRKKKRNWLN